MQVKDVVNQYYNNLSSGSEISTKTKGVEQLVSTVSNLSKGQVFEGTVSSMRGDRVTLSLSNGQTVTARMEKGVPLQEGQSVFFQVKASDGNTVRISPVSVGGTMNNPTLMDALSSAGIQATERSLNLVNSMMNEQMPVNAENLNQMNHLLNANPSADPRTIVSLVKYDMPVTPEMIEQYQNYKASEGAILETVKNLTDGIFETFSSASMPEEGTAAFLNTFSEILNGEVSLSESSNISPGEIPEMPVAQGEAAQVQETAVPMPDGKQTFPSEGTTIIISLPEAEAAADGIIKDIPLEQGEKPAEPQTVAADIKNAPPGEEAPVQTVLPGQLADGKKETDGIAGQKTPDDNILLKPGSGEEAAAQAAVSAEELPEEEELRPQVRIPTEEEKEAAREGTLAKTVSDDDLKKLDTLLKSLGSEEKGSRFEKFLDENKNLRFDSDAKELFNAIVREAAGRGNTKELLGDSSFKELMKGLTNGQWTLDPSKLKEPEALKDFYKKTATEMSLIRNAAAAVTGDPQNAVSKSAQLVQNNVEFINNLNETFSYVQLPLKLNGQNQTADLYVYTNKNKKRSEDDELSAFLHFDMENLGSTDISVKMKNKNVDTQFFMEDNDSYRLIKNNIHLLSDRLEALGYKSTISVEHDSHPVNLITDVLEKDAGTAGSLQRYSFDMRA